MKPRDPLYPGVNRRITLEGTPDQLVKALGAFEAIGVEDIALQFIGAELAAAARADRAVRPGGPTSLVLAVTDIGEAVWKSRNV